jgi:O-antigen ligase
MLRATLLPPRFRGIYNPAMAKKRRQETPSPRPKDAGVFDQVLVHALAVVIFVLPLFFFPGLTEYGYGKTMFALVAISVLLVLWAVSAYRKKEWRVRVPWIALPFLLFVVASLLSLFAAINGRVVVQSLVLAVFFFQIVLLVGNTVREHRHATLLLGSLALSAFFVSLYGLLQYLGVMQGAEAGGVNTIISTLGNKNFVGGFLGYLLLPSFVLLLRLRSKTFRVIALGVIAFNFGTLMLVNQLAPTIGLIGACVFLIAGIALFRPLEPIRRNRRWLIALLAALVLTFLIEAPPGPLNSVVGLSQSTEGAQEAPSWIVEMWNRNSGETRELDWWVGWEMLKAQPLAGVGLGNYKIAFLKYKAIFLDTPRGEAYLHLKIPRAGQAHGDYVQAAAELGGLGILAVLSFLGILAASVWLRLRRNADEAARLDILLYTAGIVVFLIHALVDFPVHLPASCLAVLLLLGLIHAPVYGDTCTFEWRVGKRTRAVATAILVVVGMTVSVVAMRDLTANVLMGQGIQELQFGNTQRAQELFERSIALDFAPRQTYYYLATTQVRLGDPEAALESYRKCFTRFTDENAYLIFADLAISLDRAEEARDTIEFLLSTNPQQQIEQKARYIEGTVAVELGDYAGAVRLMEELADDAPGFELPRIALGNLYGALDRPDDAREAFNSALELIERALAGAQNELAARTRFTAEEYSNLQQTVERMESERSYVLAQLARLPED